MLFFVGAACLSCFLFSLWERESWLGQAVSALLIIVMLMCLTMAFIILKVTHV